MSSVVANNDEILVILVTPVVVELDPIGRLGVVSHDAGDLLLQPLGNEVGQVVREAAGKPAHHVKDPHCLGLGISEGVVLQHLAAPRLLQASQVRVQQSKLGCPLLRHSPHGPEQDALRTKEAQHLGDVKRVDGILSKAASSYYHVIGLLLQPS